MRINLSNYSYQKKRIIRGYVHDEKKTPISGAIVVLEKFKPVEYGKEFDCKGTVIDYRVTNRYGYYCFVISDNSSYYKVKVFDKICKFNH